MRTNLVRIAGVPNTAGNVSFVNRGVLTFGTLLAVGTIVIPFLAAAINVPLPSLWLSAATAAVLGGGVVLNEIITRDTRPQKDQVFATIFAGLINIVILASSYYGIGALTQGVINTGA